ncbi:hypothetical protein BVX97_02670 [bacterium E08(2017)]|nr:hypothetical protein BVX97_02670 [bacterium E08(2017)]
MLSRGVHFLSEQQPLIVRRIQPGKAPHIHCRSGLVVPEWEAELSLTAAHERERIAKQICYVACEILTQTPEEKVYLTSCNEEEACQLSADVQQGIIFQAIPKINKLDDKCRVMPNHFRVFTEYCFNNLSIAKMEKKYGWSHGTISGRKKKLEQTLGQKLPYFRNIDEAIFIESAKQDKLARERNADYLNRRNLAYDDPEFDDTKY